MKIRKTIRTIILLAFVAALGGSLFAKGKPEDEAQKSAEQWLSLIDTGMFAASWKAAAGYFRTAVSQEQWEHALDAVRKPLGDVLSRRFKSAEYTKTLPGAPDGEYVILHFATSFAHKKEAVETVTPMLDKNGDWKVSGYYIK